MFSRSVAVWINRSAASHLSPTATAVCSRLSEASPSSAVIFPRATPSSNSAPIDVAERAATPSPLSINMVANPLDAKAWAMPVPINPAPTTITFPLLMFFPHNPYQSPVNRRSEEHTSELQSLMRISYAVFCLKKKKTPLLHTSLTQTARNLYKQQIQ